jgi:photosystem II stability/assembly factor-like uncharacterized protein
MFIKEDFMLKMIIAKVFSIVLISFVFFSNTLGQNNYAESFTNFETIMPKLLTKMTIDNSDQLVKLVFNDPFNGVVISDKYIYKTDDGGNSWKKTKSPEIEDIELTNVSMIDKNTFFILAEKRIDSSAPENIKSLILVTNDGGNNWNVKASYPFTFFTGIEFISKREGWVIGNKYIMKKTLENEPIILKTTNVGDSWKEFSNKAKFKQWDTLESIFISEKKEVIVSTIEGQVVNISNKPATVLSKNIAVDAGISKVGKNQNGLWFLGGRDSIEGTWSVFGYISSKNEKNWFRLPNVFIEDIIFLNETKVIACAKINDRRNNALLRYDAILYSEDSGRSWKFISKAQTGESFNSMSVTPDGNIWVIGNKGLVIKLKI